MCYFVEFPKNLCGNHAQNKKSKQKGAGHVKKKLCSFLWQLKEIKIHKKKVERQAAPN